MERGEINPTFRVLLKLCDGLRMQLSLLLRLYERNVAEAEADARARAGPEERIERTMSEESEVLAQLRDDEPTPARRLGWFGQEHAAVHLERLRLHIVERDFRTRWGRTDVIAHDVHRIVFCEVATRCLGAPSTQERTSEAHRRLGVRRTATVWLHERSQRPTVEELRFDTIALTINATYELVGLEHHVLATEPSATAKLAHRAAETATRLPAENASTMRARGVNATSAPWEAWRPQSWRRVRRSAFSSSAVGEVLAMRHQFLSGGCSPRRRLSDRR